MKYYVALKPCFDRFMRRRDELANGAVVLEYGCAHGGNAIALSASPDEIAAAVKAMFTDPNHLRIDDPGRVEGNVVFTYLDAFDEDRAALEELKAQYRRGGIGDSKIKRRLEDILQALIGPVRERRTQLAKDPAYVLDAIRSGTEKARSRTEATKREVVEGLGLFML
jgi:tryptophanyl-tRNA synthetase